MTEDRVTLPLAAVKVAAKMLCQTVCIDPWTGEVLPGGHDPTCLMATLTDAENAAAAVYAATSISQDCLKGEHPLCKGCACHHHELKTGRMRK